MIAGSTTAENLDKLLYGFYTHITYIIYRGVIIDDICSYALELAESQSSYAEVKAENGNPEATGFERSRGISVRVLVDGALGFASTNTLERSNVRMIVDEACRMAKSSSRFTKEPISFSSEQMHKDASYKVSQKENLSDIAPEDKLSLLLGLNSGIPDSLTLAGMFLELYDTQTEKTYMNSEGSSIRSFVPRVGFFGFLTLLHEGETAQAMLQKGAASGWEAIKQWDMDSYIEKELTTLQSMLVNGKACPAGRSALPVCLWAWCRRAT